MSDLPFLFAARRPARRGAGLDRDLGAAPAAR